jgi:DNA processing protein
MADRIQLLALLQIDGLEPDQIRWLIDDLGSAAAVFEATPSRLVEAGVEPELARAIAAVDEDLVWSLEDQLTDYEDTAGVRFVARGDGAYPRMLELTDEPPLFLWVRGDPAPDPGQPAVAVVGSWRATPRGLSNAELIGQRLAEQGYTTVAGLGDEIDVHALQGARDGVGYALAVLAGGVEMIAPEQANLAERILQHGALLSAALRPSDYPSRARAGIRDDVIIGLAHAVVVVEAQAEGRGVEIALRAHTAGRPVLVTKPRVDVPEGNRQLLQMGAAPVEHVGMLFERLQEALELTHARMPDVRPDAV